MTFFNKLRYFFIDITRPVWNVGLLANTVDDIVNGNPPKVRWVKHNYHDRWFADPFILDVRQNEIDILVEEFYYPKDRGRIAKLTIDSRSMSIINNQVVLDLPHPTISYEVVNERLRRLRENSLEWIKHVII